jgi:hypothetical protein
MADTYLATMRSDKEKTKNRLFKKKKRQQFRSFSSDDGTQRYEKIEFYFIENHARLHIYKGKKHIIYGHIPFKRVHPHTFWPMSRVPNLIYTTGQDMVAAFVHHPALYSI